MFHVINEGIFRGFTPINHHWVHDDPDVYYDMSNSVASVQRTSRIRKDTISAFDLEGYQIVRSQFTQIRYEGPSIRIANGKIIFNSFCMKKFSDVGYIQLLLHPAERKIAIRPCKKAEVHSIRWRMDPAKPLYSKVLSCQHFGTALYSIMKWEPEYDYKIRGIWAQKREEMIIVFNLVNAVPVTYLPALKTKNGRKKGTDLYPMEWEDDFGEEFYEHVLDNGFYYLAPEEDWNSEAESIPAPGIKQFEVPTVEELESRVKRLSRGEEYAGS